MSKLRTIPLACLIIVLAMQGCKKSGSNRRYTNEPKTLKLTSVKVNNPPVIDGIENEDSWIKAIPVRTIDKNTRTGITLKSVYTDNDIYFLAAYPDRKEINKPKSQIWDITKQKFVSGPTNEDVFIFKWAMEPKFDDLTISEGHSYEADVWFWFEVNADKSKYENNNSVREISGKSEPGDASKKSNEKNGMQLPVFMNYVFDGYVDETGEGGAPLVFRSDDSIADVRAAGKWENDKWTIEFQRKLNTGHKDEIVFNTRQAYLFGVSSFEIPGRDPEPKSGQKIYDYGDVYDKLYLFFK